MKRKSQKQKTLKVQKLKKKNSLMSIQTFLYRKTKKYKFNHSFITTEDQKHFLCVQNTPFTSYHISKYSDQKFYIFRKKNFVN